MKRFIISPPEEHKGEICLYGKDYHYLVRVRRLRAGMFFDAAFPNGKETRVKIISTFGNVLVGECSRLPETKTPEENPVPAPPIALFQGIPRGAKMDAIIRQSSEAEVAIVAPFVSEFSQAGPAKDMDGKVKRWERIVREARQQSGSTVPTKVVPPSDIDGILDMWESIKKEHKKPLGILLHHEPLEKGSFHGYLCKYPDFTALAVGPEGGFSQDEVSLFLSAGFKPIFIGRSILRTETAAIYGIAAVRTLLLESETWTQVQIE